jgi:hypothetical protein
MKKYRERKANMARTGSEMTGAAAAVNPPPAAPAYTSLAQQYGLDDMSFEAPNVEDRSVAEEYHSYVNAPVSPLSTNVVKHWEVSTFII